MKIRDILFKNQTVRQTVLKNIFWQTTSQIIGKVGRAIVIIFAARIFTPEEYGVFSYAVSFAGVFSVVSDFGIDPILTREVVRSENNKDAIISTALYLKVFFNILALVLALLVVPKMITIEASRPLVLLIGLSFFLDSLRQFFFAITRAMERMQVETGILVLNNIAVVVFGFLALIQFGTPFALSIACILGSFIGAITIAIYLHKKISIGKFYFNIARSIMKAGMPIALLSITGTILMNVDTMILGWLTSAIQVGYYSAAMKLIVASLIIPSILVAVFFPVFVKKVTKGEGATIIEKTIATVNLIAIPMTIAGIFMADEIIELIYGVQYGPAAVPFKILSINFLLTYPSIIIGYTAIAYNAQAKVIKYYVISVCTNILLSYIFIKIWGVSGAAVATILAQSIITVGYFLVLRSLGKFNIHSYLWRPCLSAAGMVLLIQILMSFRVPTFAVIVMAAGTYGVFLKFLKDPILDELVKMFHIFKEKKI